jgi:hypothetical protein
MMFELEKIAKRFASTPPTARGSGRQVKKHKKARVAAEEKIEKEKPSRKERIKSIGKKLTVGGAATSAVLGGAGQVGEHIVDPAVEFAKPQIQKVKKYVMTEGEKAAKGLYSQLRERAGLD